MDRHAPALALVAGAVLGGAAAAFSLAVTGDVARSVLLGALLSYPFTAYAVYHDDDPTTVLPPTAVLALGCLLGAATALDVAVGGGASRAVDGLFLGLLLALPAAAYAAHYGVRGPSLPPRSVAVASTLAGAALAVGGGLAGAPATGAGSGLLVGLAGALYARSRGVGLDRRARRLAVAAGLALGGALVVVGAALGGPLGPWIAVAVAVVLGPGIYHALSVERF